MKRFIISAVSVAILGVGAATARGATTYPGTMCVSNSPAGIKYATGRASNISTAGITLECPVVSFNPNGGVANDSKVFVIDQNFLADVSCRLLLLSSTSTLPSGRIYWASTAGTNPAPQVLHFGALSALTDSTISVACDVPAQYVGYNSAVVAYQIN